MAARSARGGALPHAHPFRLLDRHPDGSVGVLVSANAAWLRGAAELPPSLAIEILAQAALMALPIAPEGSGAQTGLLAGVDGVRFHSSLRPGDRLVARATLLGRLGPLLKVRAELCRGEETAVEGELLLALTAPR